MPSLEFGDRIRVLGSNNLALDGIGIFISLQGNTLNWVARDPLSGDVALFYTNVEGHTIIRV